MHHFSYKAGRLRAEDVDVAALADEVGTPFYCYSAATITRHYQVFATALKAVSPKIFYAAKANSNQAVLSLLGSLGAGVDTVSEGEVRRALKAGIPAGRIVISGVGKSEGELTFAVEQGLYQINVETEGELYLIDKIASARGRRQAIVLRVNPDVGAGGHAKITTGSDANKFGVSFSEAERLYEAATRLKGIDAKGLAVHIGSQILELSELEAAFRRLVELIGRLRAQGLKVERVDLGGGLGIPYELEKDFKAGPELIESYAAMVGRVFEGLGLELGFEPGRLIVGNAGILVARVIGLNHRADKTFLVIDAAMNDLARPAMYQAYHEIWPVRDTDAPHIVYDVVGPICESADTLAEARELPRFEPGDLLAIMTSGAYGAVMSSTYNSRLLVPEVLVSGRRHAVVRPRTSYDDLIGLDRVPGWISEGSH